MKTLQIWLKGLGKDYSLDELRELRVLNLGFNELTSIPKEIGLLSNLEDLSLYCNNLNIIPKEIGLLHNLTRLYLSYNQLACIPKEIGLLGKLERLWLGGNPNLVIFEDQIEFISGVPNSTRIEKIKVVPRNTNTDILFG